MKTILFVATAIMLCSGPVLAQTSGSLSNSNATVTNGSSSNSAANANPSITGNSVGNGASASTSGSNASASTRSGAQSSSNPNLTSTTNLTVVNRTTGGSGNRASGSTPASGNATTDPAAAAPVQQNTGLNYGGSYTVRNTPEIIAPSVVGGNPCAVGASGGVALPGFGVSAGTTWADKGCERRQLAALLYNIKKESAAVELLCQDANVREALKVSGEPCSMDQVRASIVAPAPVVAQVQQPAALTLVSHVAKNPEWCYTVSPKERNFPEVTKNCHF